MSSKKTRIGACAVVVILALVAVGCRSTTGRSFGQQVDDKTITSQVKTKLTADQFGSLFSTGVGTHYGVVHLSGNVATEQQRMQAERVARSVTGVKRVDNDIVVVARDGKSAPTSGRSAAATPSASPAATRPLALTGEVTAIDRASGDVTLRTATGDVVVRLPGTALRDLEQGQRLTINAGQP
jgi:hyperosmotically inducible periplasmic protein